jgi:hypothetical protein
MKKYAPFKIAAVVVGVPIIALGILGAFGIVVTKNPIPQKAGVNLTIENNMLVISGSSGQSGNCPPPVQTGCVRVSKWRRAHITFELVDMDDWAFSELQLVAEASANTKLDFGSQSGFTQDMIDDFYVHIDGKKVHPDTNGIINLGGLNRGDKLKLIDRNDFKQTYTYQIKACESPNNCKETDPKVVNEG